jgi:hypothetical protein
MDVLQNDALVHGIGIWALMTFRSGLSRQHQQSPITSSTKEGAG